jgi:hypothetical protein
MEQTKKRTSIDECSPMEWTAAADAIRGTTSYKKPDTYVKEEQTFFKVNHPEHYTKDRKFEPWDVVEDWNLNYFAATALKYISRYERKGDPVTDLRKAIAFLEREIERIKRKS